jgi:peptidoglycan/LPS O-acetylase OafA/YrhL
VRRIEALDGWRAISAALVILSHLQGFSAVRFSLPISNYGNLGVQYFFGISGFVIARGLLRDPGASFGGFYIRRVFRILPPLLIYIAAVVVLVFGGVLPRTALGAGEGVFFVCNLPWGDCGGWFGGHLWSLSVEEQFYLVCPFIVLATRSRKVITFAMGAAVLGAFALRLFHLSEAAGVATQFTVIATGVACAANEEWLLKLARATPAWLAALGAVDI